MLKKWALFSGMLFVTLASAACGGSDEEEGARKNASLAQNPEDVSTWRASEATRRETGIARWGFEPHDSEGVVRGYATAESIAPPEVEIRYRMTNKELVLEAKDKGAIHFDITDPDNVVVASDTLTEDSKLLANTVSRAASDLRASKAAEAESKAPSLVKTNTVHPSGKVVFVPGTLVQRDCDLIKKDCNDELIEAPVYAANSGEACRLLNTKRAALGECLKKSASCPKQAGEVVAQQKVCGDSIRAAAAFAKSSPKCVVAEVTAEACGAAEPPLNSK